MAAVESRVVRNGGLDGEALRSEEALEPWSETLADLDTLDWTARNDLDWLRFAQRLHEGEKIDKLLAKRADTTADEEAAKLKEVSSIRPVTIGLLNRMREAMEDEVSMNDELDDSLANKVFAYYDQISETREDRGAKPKAPPVTA